MSIRLRLTLWYGAALALGLLIYGGAIYVMVRHNLSSDLDRRLHDDFERAEHAVVRDGDGLRWLAEEGHHDSGPPDHWVEYHHPEGGLILRRPSGSIPATEPYRVKSGPYDIDGIPVEIRVGRSQRPMHAELERLLLVLGLALPVLVVLAGLGGGLLARRALDPIRTMAERARSITAERLSERLPVQDPNDELGQLAAVLNELLTRLEASFERLRRFTADASHELRTPLTAIRSVGEVGLQEQRDAAAYRDVIGSMLEEADRLTRMVDGLLTLSRADAGRIPIHPEDRDLAALAREVTEHLTPLAEEKDQAIACEGEPLNRSVDPVLLRQALINLVDNAIKHSPRGAKIRVTVGQQDGSVVQVSDDGPGISPEHRDLVFDRFYRVDPARAGHGTGLGLSVARWIVSAHGGSIELVSDGAGSTFKIRLP